MMDPRILPETFSLSYEQLWTTVFSDGGPGAGVGRHPLSGEDGIIGRAPGKIENGGWRVSTAEADMVGARKAGGGTKGKMVGKTSRALADERAMRFRSLIDKRLRGIAREITAFLDGTDWKSADQRICTSCRKIGQKDWNFCPRDGKPMREID